MRGMRYRITFLTPLNSKIPLTILLTLSGSFFLVVEEENLIFILSPLLLFSVIAGKGVNPWIEKSQFE